MTVPEATTTLRTDGEWRTKYRDLCREFDAAQAMASDLRAALSRILSNYDRSDSPESQRVSQAIAALRDDSAPLNVQLLRQVAEQCARSSRGAPAAWASWQVLLEQLKVPPTQDFALKHLRERGQDHHQDSQWVAQLAALINDCVAVVASSDALDTDSQGTSQWAPLLDWLLLPPDFERRAAQLREALNSGTCEAPVHDIGKFLNDLYAFLRRDLRSLGEYLKTATLNLSSVAGDLQAALQDSQEAANASECLTSKLDTEVAAIDSAINGDLSIPELKAAIDSRVQSIRASVSSYVDNQRGKQADYEQRITELAARVKAFEQESDTLRQEMLVEQEKAYRDPLTQLPNRLAYEERSQLEFVRARRTAAPLTLAILDLDRFKRINDTFGHKVGDKVLRHTAELCRRRTRDSDLLARFGGEEFVALFPDTALPQASQVCEELRHHVELATFQYQGQRVPVTVSVGVAELGPGDTLETLFERADQALYAAKRDGRNRVAGV
jgi:diguanylate cyclase (GGDEF)-like protein